MHLKAVDFYPFFLIYITNHLFEMTNKNTNIKRILNICSIITNIFVWPLFQPTKFEGQLVEC